MVELLFKVWSPIYDSPVFQRTFYRRVHARVGQVLDDVRITPERVMDLGAGTAQLTDDLRRRWPRTTVVGFDLSPDMLAAAKRRLGTEAPPLVRGNVYALPFGAGVFEVVTSSISYHWYLEPRRALAEVRRVMKVGGRFVLATMTPWPMPVAFGSMRMATAPEIEADLAACGFRIRERRRVRPAVSVFDCEAQ